MEISGSDLVDGSLLRGCSHWEWFHSVPKHCRTTLIYTVKLFTSQFATLTAIFLCLFWWWTHQNYIPLPTFTTIYSVNVVTDSMHVMACFFQGWPVSAGVNFHCIQPWSTKTGWNWHYQNWCRLVKWVQGQKHLQTVQISKILSIRTIGILLRTAVLSKLHQHSMAPA